MINFNRYNALIGFIVSLAMFMEAVDSTIINTAIPVMAQSLSVNPIDLKIALISYLLSLAIFIPISGWLADKYGVKNIFISALIVFTISSIWCGYAHSISELIVARCVQGIGGSLMMPVGRLILLRTFERHQMVHVMGRIVMVAALGLMLGPVLGGFITEYFSWRWVFWVNIPVGLFAIITATIFIKKIPPITVHRLDTLGFIIFGFSLAAFTFGLAAFSETVISDSLAFFIMSISILSFISYFIHSRHIANPIVNTLLFKQRTFRISVIGNLTSRLGFAGVPFLLPLLFQIGLNYSPQTSGLLLAPTALGVLLVKPFTVPILRFVGYKPLLILNTICVAISLWLLSTVTQDTSLYYICVLTFLYGFLISLQYTGMNSLAYADISHTNLSAATSIMSTLQQLAQSFGVAAAALFVRIYSDSAIEKISLTMTVFHHALFAMGVVTLISTVIFLQLKPEDGNQMINAPQRT